MSAENGTLQEFDVTITETLKMTVNVEAASREEAEQMVSDGWRNSEYILDADNFTDVEFEASPVSRELARDAQPHEKGESNTMEGNENMANTAVNSEPLSENQYVKELFSILQDNGKDSAGLSALLGHVTAMEDFVKRAEDRIAEMKTQLAEIKEVQDHPVKTSLQNAIKNLEQKVAEIKERIGELKANIINGCKNAVDAFREKGITALDKLASFFRIKDDLQDLNKRISNTIKADDNAMAKIESFANEYHSAGRAIKNMARVAVGKKPISAKKEAGKLAKAVSAPYKAQKAMLIRMQVSVNKAISSLDRLEARAADKKAERATAKKPSLMGQLKENLEAVEQAKREHRALERATSKGAEL